MEWSLHGVLGRHSDGRVVRGKGSSRGSVVAGTGGVARAMAGN